MGWLRHEMKNAILFALLLSCVCVCVADTWTDPDTVYTWTYRINGDTAEIYKGAWSAAISPTPIGALPIPSQLGGKLVTSIGSYAFCECSGLTSVTIPNSVTNVGTSAFGYCTNLTNVTIGTGVTSIGSSAFSNCSGLTSVIIPNSVTNIGYSAFSNCSSLTNVAIGTGLMSIGTSAFHDCSGLMSFAVDEGNAIYSSLDGLLLSKNGNALICGVNGDVVIPDSVTNIGSSAFEHCGGLTSVTIPDSVASIGSSAFSHCTNLTSVTIGTGVTSIGGGAFCYCSCLMSFAVDEGNAIYSSLDGLLLSKDGTVLMCGVNGDVVIPGSVTNISSRAFA